MGPSKVKPDSVDLGDSRRPDQALTSARWYSAQIFTDRFELPRGSRGSTQYRYLHSVKLRGPIPPDLANTAGTMTMTLGNAHPSTLNSILASQAFNQSSSIALTSGRYTNDSEDTRRYSSIGEDQKKVVCQFRPLPPNNKSSTLGSAGVSIIAGRCYVSFSTMLWSNKYQDPPRTLFVHLATFRPFQADGFENALFPPALSLLTQPPPPEDSGPAPSFRLGSKTVPKANDANTSDLVPLSTLVQIAPAPLARGLPNRPAFTPISSAVVLLPYSPTRARYPRSTNLGLQSWFNMVRASPHIRKALRRHTFAFTLKNEVSEVRSVEFCTKLFDIRTDDGSSFHPDYECFHSIKFRSKKFRTLYTETRGSLTLIEGDTPNLLEDIVQSCSFAKSCNISFDQKRMVEDRQFARAHCAFHRVTVPCKWFVQSSDSTTRIVSEECQITCYPTVRSARHPPPPSQVLRGFYDFEPATEMVEPPLHPPSGANFEVTQVLPVDRIPPSGESNLIRDFPTAAPSPVFDSASPSEHDHIDDTAGHENQALDDSDVSEFFPHKYDTGVEIMEGVEENVREAGSELGGSMSYRMDAELGADVVQAAADDMDEDIKDCIIVNPDPPRFTGSNLSIQEPSRAYTALPPNVASNIMSLDNILNPA